MSLYSKVMRYIRQDIIGCLSCGRKLGHMNLCYTCDEWDLYEQAYHPIINRQKT